MARAIINVGRLVDNIKKTNVYTPIIEAVVNSLDSIEETNRDDGKIIVTLFRQQQKSLLKGDGEDNLKPISRVQIEDNGSGFNQKNLVAFNTIYTEEKIKTGGKGFGRFVYLKYFEEVEIESIFNDRGSFQKASFRFLKDNDFIKDESTQEIETPKDLKTIVTLHSLKKEHISKLDKKLDTVARKLLENLLFYFVLDDYMCPTVIVRDDESGKEIILNDYLGEGKDIVEIDQGEQILVSEDKSSREKFKFKVFKIFYGASRSSVNLVANHRQVTEEALHVYVPEFKGDFLETSEGDKSEEINKTFTVKAYVTGKYLDKYVSIERDGFDFEDDKDMLHPFSRRQIESKIAESVKGIFGTQVKTRQEKKEAEIRKYIEEEAPWHKTYIKDDDISDIPFGINNFDLETELQKIRHKKEILARGNIKKILEKDEKDVASKARELVNQIGEIGKSELAHYVALRKTILDLFKESLRWNDDKKFEKEKVVHDIIFPQRKNTDSISYDSHNLWILDEKLSFTEYLSSDEPLNTNDERPDILSFDRMISFRGGEELSNPITVFEFKRPQRSEYDEDTNPLKQIADYIQKIRDGKFKQPDGRPINVNENTPAYGFLVCDITSKIDSFCKDFTLTKSPDNMGYFGFHPNHRIYFEVISFDKLVRDSELRNKILFKKLGIV